MKLIVPVPVMVRLVAFDVFQEVEFLATVHVPEPIAIVRVLVLAEETPPAESVKL